MTVKQFKQGPLQEFLFEAMQQAWEESQVINVQIGDDVFAIKPDDSVESLLDRIISKNKQLISVRHSASVGQKTILEVVEKFYQDKNGAVKAWFWVRRPEPVVIVIAMVDGKLLVTKEFRQVIDGWEYGFVAGLIDGNETPEEAAKRELKEESGLECKKILGKSRWFYSTPGLTDEQYCYVVVEASGKPSTDFLDASEQIEPMLLAADGVKKILDDNQAIISSRAYHDFISFAQTGELLSTKMSVLQ